MKTLFIRPKRWLLRVRPKNYLYKLYFQKQKVQSTLKVLKDEHENQDPLDAHLDALDPLDAHLDALDPLEDIKQYLS
jgi:hypothetical protein